jgi:hypothetical protein
MDQKARQTGIINNPLKSAKPPPPVQIRAAPPLRQFETIRVQIDEQAIFDRFDSLAMRCVDDVRVDVERRRDRRMAQLLLSDLHRYAEIVQ